MDFCCGPCLDPGEEPALASDMAPELTKDLSAVLRNLVCYICVVTQDTNASPECHVGLSESRTCHRRSTQWEGLSREVHGQEILPITKCFREQEAYAGGAQPQAA